MALFGTQSKLGSGGLFNLGKDLVKFGFNANPVGMAYHLATGTPVKYDTPILNNTIGQVQNIATALAPKAVGAIIPGTSQIMNNLSANFGKATSGNTRQGEEAGGVQGILNALGIGNPSPATAPTGAPSGAPDEPSKFTKFIGDAQTWMKDNIAATIGIFAAIGTIIKFGFFNGRKSWFK